MRVIPSSSRFPVARLCRAIGLLVAIAALCGSLAAQAAEPLPSAFGGAAVARIEQEIAAYKDIAASGGWAGFADGPTLREGDSDPRIPALRRRLAATDRWEPAPSSDERYTPDLANAVRRFQARHGLAVDGVVGNKTRAALDVPVTDRIRMLALNLDRLRALSRDLPPRAVVVNVAAATLTLVSDGREELVMRVIVGRPSWPTPTLVSAIGRIEVNPYWNVPPRIARSELVPLIARDPGYLARQGMRVLGGPAGRDGESPASAIDWRRFGALGYRLRQDPGPDNPLGTLKFYFDNPYDVFLHDTPAKANFRRAERTLSHGCVRVENAFGLAMRLLRDDPAWSEDRLHEAIATGANRQIRLARMAPVYFVYLTAWVDPDGTVQFRPDVYRRDELTRTAARPESCGVS